MTISWHLETRKIKELREHPKNPRILTKEASEHLKTSMDKFGVIDKPIVNPDGLIIGGHQRIKVLKSMKVKEVECWVPEEALDERQVDELNIRLNKNTGTWDFEILANQWEPNDLMDWGFTEGELLGLGRVEEDKSDISLPSGQKPISTLSFTLSIEQEEMVNRCLKISKDIGDFVETGNENSNGNALARICELWLPHYDKR